MGYPGLVSANRLWVKTRKEPGWVSHDRVLAATYGGDVALDCGGFTLGGKFPWTVEDYVWLAGQVPWAWWAQMDVPCEPEQSSPPWPNIERTVQLLGECRAVAADYRYEGWHIADPMPVIQGWSMSQYLTCMDMMTKELEGEWPRLIGIGSVCRRHRTREIVHIVTALMGYLPDHVSVHLFGVKGEALDALKQHDRVASMDSQAWDLDARYCTNWGECRPESGHNPWQHRAAHLERWYERNRAR
jgi:hypothetical protein